MLKMLKVQKLGCFPISTWISVGAKVGSVCKYV